MGAAKCMERAGELTNTYKLISGKPEGNRLIWVDGIIMIKRVFEKE
jgi:hypothetical protein